MDEGKAGQSPKTRYGPTDPSEEAELPLNTSEEEFSKTLSIDTLNHDLGDQNMEDSWENVEESIHINQVCLHKGICITVLIKNIIFEKIHIDKSQSFL